MYVKSFNKLLWLSGLALFCLAYGFFIEPHRLVVRDVNIVSPHYDGEPIRIGLMSDIHVGGRLVHSNRVGRIVDRLNSETPDIILLTGDYTSGSSPKDWRGEHQIADITAGHAHIGRLNAPLGVYAVLGNHDHQYGADIVRNNIEGGGFTFIDNDHRMARQNLCVFGMADEYYGKPNRDGWAGCPKGANMIGIAHNPDTFLFQPVSGALLLAGHTHGGQVNLPVFGRRVTSTHAGPAYAYGPVTFGDVPGFVTAGIGQSILTVRFRAPPEIVVITLRGE